MELLLVLLFLLLLGSPAVAIVALVLAIKAQSRIRDLEKAIKRDQSKAPEAKTTKPLAPQSVGSERPKRDGYAKWRTVIPAKDKSKDSAKDCRSERPVAPPKTKAPSLEQALGGKAAAIVGIAVLVLGVGFLVVYAIQNAWIGPGARVVLGLILGGVLVAVGHLAERRSVKLRYLARVLTGGGVSLFYFCVFAAYGFYELIGRMFCGAGLLLSALAVLGLAWAYSSQLVALLGVVGAFLTPLLVGHGMEPSAFTLSYVALVNLPVIGFALKRRWQSLYNVAFGGTLFYLLITLEWMSSPEHWLVGIGLLLVCFVEFVGLGLMKLRGEQQPLGRRLDIARLMLNSLMLMGVLYFIMEQSGHGSWLGAAFLIAAVIHIVLARASWRWLPKFEHETLAFLVSALTFASLALPIQLDGPWVCVGWSIEGLILAWFALRVGSRNLQTGAVFLGLIGLGKALVYDVTLYDVPPDVFLNARFGAGLLSALLLAFQSVLYSRFSRKSEWENKSLGAPLLTVAVLGLVAVMFADAFWTIGTSEPLTWALTSMLLMVTAVVTILLARNGAPCGRLAVVLLFAIPAKILFLDLRVCYFELHHGSQELFISLYFWLQAVIIAVLILLNRWLGSGGKQPEWKVDFGRWLNFAALASGILLVSFEFGRVNEPWSNTAVTLWWSLCALGLVAWGFSRRTASYRYAGLLLFGITAYKIFFVDLSELSGFFRIVAFMGAGILLLLLSFLYQQLSVYLLDESHEGGASQEEEDA